MDLSTVNFKDLDDVDTAKWLASIDECDDPADLKSPKVKMPKPSQKSFDESLGQEGGSLLGKLLNPNCGGKGANKNGLKGLVAVDTETMTPKQRAMAKKRALYRQRCGISTEERVRDHKGKIVKGAKKMTQEDLQFGNFTEAQRQALQREAARRKAMTKTT
jgi:hypothetical protein